MALDYEISEIWGCNSYEIDGWMGGCVGGTNLSASFFTEVLVVAFHELSLAVEVEALLQAPLVDHVQADLQAMATRSEADHESHWSIPILKRTQHLVLPSVIQLIEFVTSASKCSLAPSKS